MSEEPNKKNDKIDLKELFSEMSVSNTDMEGELPPATSIELTHEIVEAMFDETKIKMITDLTELEIKGILKLITLNEIVFDGRKSILSTLCNEIMLLKVSKNRGGRREMIKAIFSSGGGVDEEPSSRFKRFIN